MQSKMNVMMVWAWPCYGHRMSNKNVVMVWAWMPWSSDAVEHERHYGLGALEYTRGCCVMPPVTTTIYNMTTTMTTMATIALSGVGGGGRWPVAGGRIENSGKKNSGMTRDTFAMEP